MKLRLKICLIRDEAAAIQLEFFFQTQQSVSTGELWDLFRPTIAPVPEGLGDATYGFFKVKRVDTLIDIMTDKCEEVSTMDYVLEFNNKFFAPAKVYERVFAVLAKDNRFDWEV